MSITEAVALQEELIPEEAEVAFTAEREAFLAAVVRVREALPGRTTMAVLTGIQIEARSDGSVRLRATDLERDIETSFPADVAIPGATVPAGAALVQLLGSAPKGAVRCTGDGRQFTVVWGRASFKLPAFRAEEYPDPPAVDESGAVELSGEALAGLARVGFAATPDGARPVLQGVHLRVAEEGLVAVACDGMRVARAAMLGTAWPGSAALVPAAGLALAAKALGGAERIDVAAGQGSLQLAGGGTTLRLRLLEGRYPGVEDLLPKEYPTVLAVERAALIAALERAGIVSRSAEQLHLVRLAISPDGLTCRAETADGGSGSEEIDAAVNGDPVEVGVNGLLLRETLRHLGGATVRIEVSGPLTAMRLSGETGPTCWQMPVRVG